MLRRGSCAVREVKVGLRKREHRGIAAGMNPPQAVDKAHAGFCVLAAFFFFPFLDKLRGRERLSWTFILCGTCCAVPPLMLFIINTTQIQIFPLLFHYRLNLVFRSIHFKT